jgi:hypothetical protein
MGIDIDTKTCYFFAPAAKLHKLAKQGRQLLQRATRASGWVHVNELQSFAGHAQFLFSRYPGCKILPARIALRTRRQVGRPSPSHPSAPSRPTVVDPGAQPRKWQEYPPPGRFSLHTLRQFGLWLGSSTQRQTQARGFWGPEDEHQHITWKELKAVRLAVLSFLPLLVGRNILLLEDNQAVC